MRQRSKPARYGHGRWKRGQVYAIIASYREQGRAPDWVAAKIGVGPALVRQIYDYLEWSDEEAYRVAAGSAGGDPQDCL